MSKGLLRPVPAFGSIAWDSGTEYMNDRLRYRLLTPLGSRLGHETTFGSRLPMYVHRGVPEDVLVMAAREALAQEAGIKVKSVKASLVGEVTKIEIHYSDGSGDHSTSIEVQ